MTTPVQGQTPVSTPPVTHGVGNPAGTPVVAPTRSKAPDGAGGSLGTFGVRSLHSNRRGCLRADSFRGCVLALGEVGACSDAEG